MAVDRVKLVREGFEGWKVEDPQLVLNHTHPEVEWIAPERDPFPGTYRGYEGVQCRRGWSTAGTTSSSSPTVGPQRHHRASDLRQDRPVFSFDQDKCVRVQEFYDRGGAMKAAGLG